MGYCGECEHWVYKPGEDGMKASELGTCNISGSEAAKTRHGCIMYAQRRKLEESGRSPIEVFKALQANEKK